jgi:dTDP-4-amino-4,6-dideoxygalactose transaminase
MFEEHQELGYNYRMTDIQAAIGVEQLKRADDIIDRRREIAEFYLAAIREIPHISSFEEPTEDRFNFQSFAIYVEDNSPISRNELIEYFLENQIASKRGIMLAHREKPYLSEGPFSLPVSEDMTDNSLLIPLFSQMSIDDAAEVINRLRQAVSGESAAKRERVSEG